MNQDQVVEQLLKLNDKVEDFTLTFSGNASTKVDGLYYPDKQEIILHNRNFSNDNQLIYTAIHEFAHHIHCTTSAKQVTSRAHTIDFWNIFHNLLIDAEKKKIYDNVFKTDFRFVELSKEIKEKFIHVDAKLMKDLGRLLIDAYQLCKENHTIFEDYVDRELLLHRGTAKNIIKIYNQDVNPEIGFENMKIVASIKDDDIREMAQDAFLQGKTPDMVKAEFTSKPKPDNLLDGLFAEKERIEKSLDRLTIELAKVERRIVETEEEMR
ncbi:MAG: hypothetical protein GY754_33575 [bacterium]|nr:hypothetical protein [bacterium]